MRKFVVLGVLFLLAFAMPAGAQTRSDCTICAAYCEFGLLEALAAHCETGRHEYVDESENSELPTEVTVFEPSDQTIEEITQVTDPLMEVAEIEVGTLNEDLQSDPVTVEIRGRVTLSACSAANMPPGLILFNNRIGYTGNPEILDVTTGSSYVGDQIPIPTDLDPLIADYPFLIPEPTIIIPIFY